MKRRLTVALATGALVAATIPGLASAGAPVGGCPTGDGSDWYLIQPQHPSPADQNGDGYLCRRELSSGLGGPFLGGFTFRDNVVRD